MDLWLWALYFLPGECRVSWGWSGPGREGLGASGRR